MQSKLERAMGMSDAVWERHANPWSGWSRMAIPFLLTVAAWSRIWFGWWALLFLPIIIVWTWWNPRAFPAPKSQDSWMTRGVLGERIWLDRKRTLIPAHHARMAGILAGATAIGLIPFAWGLWQLDIWATVAGLVLIIGGKLWFLDRMVWLLDETSAADMRGSKTEAN